MAVWRGRCGTEAVSGGSRSPHLSQSGRHSSEKDAFTVGHYHASQRRKILGVYMVKTFSLDV